MWTRSRNIKVNTNFKLNIFLYAKALTHNCKNTEKCAPISSSFCSFFLFVERQCYNAKMFFTIKNFYEDEKNIVWNYVNCNGKKKNSLKKRLPQEHIFEEFCSSDLRCFVQLIATLRTVTNLHCQDRSQTVFRLCFRALNLRPANCWTHKVSTSRLKQFALNLTENCI